MASGRRRPSWRRVTSRGSCAIPLPGTKGWSAPWTSERRVLVLLGRVHLYEGRSAAEVVHPVRVAVLAGCPVVVLTNAAGGLDPGMRKGQAVLIRDQINLTGASPLGTAAARGVRDAFCRPHGAVPGETPRPRPRGRPCAHRGRLRRAAGAPVRDTC